MKEMFIEAFDKRGGGYIRKILPFLYEYRSRNKRSIYPIQKNGFCIYGDSLSLSEDDLEELKTMGKYGEELAQEARDSMGYCCDTCGETWVTKELSLAELTFLLSRWDSGMPRWLYQKIIENNYRYFSLN